MKRITLAIITTLFAASAVANYNCPYPPYAPPGCKQVCVCDGAGQNCRYITICNR